MGLHSWVGNRKCKTTNCSNSLDAGHRAGQVPGELIRAFMKTAEAPSPSRNSARKDRRGIIKLPQFGGPVSRTRRYIAGNCATSELPSALAEDKTNIDTKN